MSDPDPTRPAKASAAAPPPRQADTAAQADPVQSESVANPARALPPGGGDDAAPRGSAGGGVSAAAASGAIGLGGAALGDVAVGLPSGKDVSSTAASGLLASGGVASGDGPAGMPQATGGDGGPAAGGPGPLASEGAAFGAGPAGSPGNRGEGGPAAAASGPLASGGATSGDGSAGLPPGSGFGGVPPDPGSPPARTRGWVKALLAASLALNLAIGGLFAGSLLRDGAKAPRVERDIGLGAVGQAMTREDWRAMRPAFLARHPDLKRGPEVLRGDFDAVLATLRADPFDAAAMTAALQTISQRNADRLDSAVRVISAYLAALPPEGRGAFADRLEKILTRDRDTEQAKAKAGKD